MLKIKRLPFWIIGSLVVVMIGMLIVAYVIWAVSGLPSTEDFNQGIIREMDAILQASRNNPTGPPPEEIQKWALLTPNSAVWTNLQHWMADAPGRYQIEITSFDDAYSPGIAYVVQAALSNGLTIACDFYNSTITLCWEVKE